MRRRSTPGLLAVWVAACCVALFAVSAFAQYQTGNIYGRAQAKDGSVLPGVTVTLTGVGAPQTAVTDASGNFRFLNLSPGQYQLKGELSGYGSAIRTGVGVRVAQNADVTLTLNPSVSESITVTAEAPLLDVRKAGTGTNVPKVELEKIPTSRDPWTVLQSVPSVMVDRINVGGTQSGQQSNYIAKGALGRDNSWNVDGVNITDMGATGSSPTYFDFDSFEEMQVTTGGSDPRIQTPGVQLNMVTKRGTNDFRGSGRYLYTPESLSDEASVPGEASGYLSLTNKVHYIRDYGAELGGPILRDRLWFWGARADQKISVWQSLGIPAPAVFVPDDTILRNKNFKLNGQIMASNSAVGFYTFGDKFRNARNLSTTRPFETAYKQTGPTKVYKLEDTQIIGSSLYLTGMWSKVDGGFGLLANGGQGLSAPSRWVDKDGVNHDNYYAYLTSRPQKQSRLDGSKFFDIGKMNHELKFGFGYRKTPVESTSTLPGPATGFMSYSVTGTAANAKLCANQGLPDGCFRATLIRPVDVAFDEKYRDFYVGDTILMGNLTVVGGLRWDRQQSTNTGVSIEGNPILSTPLSLPCTTALKGTGVCDASGNLTAALPAASYSGDPKSLKWNTVAPRIGLTYSLGADKRTLLRASYNRYVSQQGSAVSGANPLAYSAFYFYGFDANGDHTVQRNELLKIRNYTGVNPADPTAIAITRRVDYGMKVPHSDEFLVGAERELMTDFSVGVNYTYRKYNDLFVTRFEKHPGQNDFYTAADYVAVLCTNDAGCGVGPSFVQKGQQLLAGGTVTLKDPATGQVITTFNTTVRPVWQLAPGVPTPTYRVLTNRENYSQKFGGLELTATKRLSHRWMLRANASYNDYTESCGANSQAGVGANPTQTLGACPGGQVAPQSAGSGAFANDFINSKWQFNLTGLFVAPWDINLGASLTARQGYPSPLRDNVTGTRGGDLAVVLNDIGTVRFDNVYELDLRVAKDFRIANRLGLTLSGDLFNAPNKRTVLQRNTLVLQNEQPLASGWRITELQAPRVWRMGAKITF
jgi:hypothetical protein